MTANGEVQTREEATVYVKHLDLFVKVKLLERNSRSSFLGETLWGSWVFIPLKKRSKTSSHQKWQKNWLQSFELCTIFSPWFIYQRVLPQLHLHQLLHHLHQRIPYLTSTDTPKIQYQKEVEVRVKSFGEIRCMNPQKPKTKIKMRNAKKYKEICRMNCLIGYRNSERIWLMKVTSTEPWGNPEQGSRDTSKSPHEFPTGPRAKVEPGSGKHSENTQFPKDPNCDFCLKTKRTRASCRRRAGTVVPRAEHLGDLITADHKILSEESESRNNHRCAVVVQDLATHWVQFYPCKTKSSQETQKYQMKFLEPTRKQKVIHTDNSMKFGKSCEELSWKHCMSTPHRSETNGIAGRAVSRVKEETSVVLLQGPVWGNEWWAESMECYCYLRNIQDLLSDGKTPCETRFGMPFDGPVILFGAMVEYHPISAKDLSRLHQVGPKVLPGFSSFMHYARGESGKETLWSQTLKSWRRWTHQNSTPEGSMERKCWRHKEVDTSYSQSQMEQSKS